MALLVGEGTRKEICCYCSLSDEAKQEMERIKEETREMIKPLYDDLKVDIDTEELHWTNGEVFVINKKTKKRRELGREQEELNIKMIDSAIKIKRVIKEKNETPRKPKTI